MATLSNNITKTSLFHFKALRSKTVNGDTVSKTHKLIHRVTTCYDIFLSYLFIILSFDAEHSNMPYSLTTLLNLTIGYL